MGIDFLNLGLFFTSSVLNRTTQRILHKHTNNDEFTLYSNVEL